MTESLNYDVFISYARADNKTGWVSWLFDTIYEDFREFSSEPFKIFFDTEGVARSRHIGHAPCPRDGYC